MCKTIKLRVRFAASPPDIYELLTDARKLRTLTGKPAANDRVVGGRFSSYAGAVSGVNVDLLPGKRVVQAWRERAFPIGIFSMATFNLAPTARGGTELTLTHRGVPKDLIPRITHEWRDHYWERMKAFLAKRD